MQQQGETTRGLLQRRGVAAGLLAFLGAVTLLVLVSIIGSSPTVCAGCHGDQRDALAATGHADARCYDCHLAGGAWGWPKQKGDELFRMYPSALIGRRLTRPANATARSACLSCHAEVLEGATTGARLHVDHRVCAGDATCDGCHGTTVHPGAVRWPGQAVMEECVACHSAEDVSITCETCHVKDADRAPSDAPNGPWQVTHGADWEQTHGLGDTESCSVCHPKGYCTRCHGVDVPHAPDFGGTHGAAAQAAPESCERCHSSREEFCDACHPMEMPHPEGFLAGHSTVATGQADERCFACHADTDCGNCHSAHIHPGGSTGVPVPWTLTPEERRP